jgi:hypothetical protein
MGQDISGSVCGDPVSSTWTVNTVSWTRPGQRNVDEPWDNDCVAKGSAEEKRRLSIYQGAASGRGGGWMCVYEGGEDPHVTIRSFYPPPCSPAGEQKPVRVPVKRMQCDQPPTPPTQQNDEPMPVS